MESSKKPVKKAAKKKVLGSPSSAPQKGFADPKSEVWRKLALRLAVELGWAKKDMRKVFGDGWEKDC